MDDLPNRGLLGIGDHGYEELPVSDSLGWLRRNLGQIVRGGVYLLAGQPGIGKSTLGLQLALDLGRQGERTVYVLTEQSKEDVARRARLLSSDWQPADRDRALAAIDPVDTVHDIAGLPRFLAQHVMAHHGQFHGASLIVVDSIQGQGMAATATRQYRELYEFSREAKEHGLVVLLVAHVTKRGEIAGPKTLEHTVDAVMYMRKAFAYRPFFVPKNRFGPAVLTPIPLRMNRQTTALELSPLSHAVSSIARTFLGRSIPNAEAQAAVQLPVYGSRGTITAPGLPRKEVEQILNSIAQLPELEIGDLSYTIQCRIPGERRFRRVLGLPLAMALISSYIQRDIPNHHLYIGELDLLRQVREVSPDLLTELVDAIQAREIEPPLRIFMPSTSAVLLRSEVPQSVTVVSCTSLEDAIYSTWPELRQNAREQQAEEVLGEHITQ